MRSIFHLRARKIGQLPRQNNTDFTAKQPPPLQTQTQTVNIENPFS